MGEAELGDTWAIICHDMAYQGCKHAYKVPPTLQVQATNLHAV